MYRTGKEEDSPALRKLGNACFGDTKEFLDLFYGMRYRPENTVVCEEGGETTAMAFALPLTARTRAGDIPAAYVYSVGTDPAHRGKGISSGLMEYLWGELTGRGIKLALLVPAEKGLFDFYGRLGYKNLTSICGAIKPNGVCRNCSTRTMSIEPAGAKEYFLLREKLLADTPHFVWDEASLKYQNSFSGLLGGGLYLLGGGIGCAVMEMGADGVVLKELLAPADDMADAADAFSNSRVRCSHTELRTTPELGEAIGLTPAPFTMGRWTEDVDEASIQGMYFGLALD